MGNEPKQSIKANSTHKNEIQEITKTTRVLANQRRRQSENSKGRLSAGGSMNFTRNERRDTIK